MTRPHDDPRVRPPPTTHPARHRLVRPHRLRGLRLLRRPRATTVHGVDNNQRAVFFGPQGDTRWNQAAARARAARASSTTSSTSATAPACSRSSSELRPDVIVHTAAQPSHDRAAAIPFDDFDTNAVGTLNLLEAARQACPESPFVHMCTNKVYGDRPNTHPRCSELDTRWDYADPAYADGIPETLPHRPVQALPLRRVARSPPTSWSRSTAATSACPPAACAAAASPGPNHSGRRAARLPQLPREVQPRGPRVPGLRLQGQAGPRQHPLPATSPASSTRSSKRPRSGEVYNLGGGKANSCSILEAFRIAEELTGKPQVYTYVDENRDRRPHLLLQRPAQDEAPTTRPGTSRWLPRGNDRPDRRRPGGRKARPVRILDHRRLRLRRARRSPGPGSSRAPATRSSASTTSCARAAR